MIGVLRKLWGAGVALRLRWRASADGTPRSAVRLCEWLQEHGRESAALQEARLWLARFPASLELQDLVRAAWSRNREAVLYTLARKLERKPTVPSFERMIHHLLDHAQLAKATRFAERMVEIFPAEARAHFLRGKVGLIKLQRDHLAADGHTALRSFERCLEVDAQHLKARLGLAETFDEIGATSKAAWQALLAMELDPSHPDARELYDHLKAKPIRASLRDEERDLLVAVEENDQAGYESGRLRLGERLTGAVKRGVQELSKSVGIRRAVASFRGINICGERGLSVRHSEGDRQQGFVDLAVGFRRSASLVTKRLGLGAFHEAELLLSDRKLMAFSVGPDVLLLEANRRLSPKVVASDARNYVALWSSQMVRTSACADAGAGSP